MTATTTLRAAAIATAKVAAPRVKIAANLAANGAKTIATADWAPALEAAARALAIAIAFTYAAGYALGQRIHTLNEECAVLFAVLLGLPPTARRARYQAPAVDYTAFTVQQLRKFCKGTKGAYRFTRAQCLAVLAAA